MEIFNGTQQTARYYPTDLSPGDTSSPRELERAENESSYVRNLRALKAKYVSDERLFEPERLAIQQKLYGMSMTTTGHNKLWGGGGYFNNGWSAYPWSDSPAYGGYGGYAPWPEAAPT